ncbi:histidine kinase N-terminal 7TM domain-containing protein [Haloarcula onubensis]|uniref:PAS domain-containing protein n=1 Tax=Haloarcula onubensis TaxID=2950539 RepID=A0ABU2FTL5_9EURY|nr:histidine kinase N-terminal 7TM domain-containing protein [Halomicroarcula sp. S3CR25-11]MDS0284108.1 PAS domain-containing protein [Halomicroarcula sp. S3CR25-11]
MQTDVFLAVLALSVVAAVAAIYLLAVNRSRPGAAPLLVAQFGELWWLGCYIGELLAQTPSVMLAFARVQQVGVVVIPLAWTVFVFEYTGRGHHVTRRRLTGLAVVPAVALSGSLLAYERTIRVGITVASTDGLSALAGTYGPLYWLFAVYTWLLVTGSAILLAEFVVEGRSLYRGRALVLLTAGFVPVGTNFLETLHLIGDDVFRMTPLTFAVSAGLAALAVVEFDMFRRAPVPSHLASETAMTATDDPTFVLDGERTVVDCNPAALDLVGMTRSTLLGTPARAVPNLADVDADSAGSTVTVESDVGQTYYDVQVASIDDSDHVFGSVVTFRDVTDRRERKRQLRALNEVLRATIQEEVSAVGGAVHGEVLTGATEGGLPSALAMSDRAGELASMLDEEAESPVDIVPIIHEEIDAAREWEPDVSFVLEASLGEWAYCNGLFEPVFRVSLRHAARRSLLGDTEPVVGVSVTAGPDAVTVSVSDAGPPLTDRQRSVLCDGAEPQPADREDMSRWLVNWGAEQAGGIVTVGTDGDHTSLELTFPRTDCE